MRCLEAPPDELCRVAFEFEVGERTFRVERTPDQERAAQRGQGMVKVQSKATLWETTGGTDHVLASAVRPVDAKVLEVLGLSSDQFCQVVLLPQGKFEGMLKAKANEREEVMRVLFQTDRYLAIQNRFGIKAKEAEDAISDLLKLRDNILGSVECEKEEDLPGLLAQNETARTEQEAIAGKLRDGQQNAQEKLNAANAVLEKLIKRNDADAALRQIEAQKPAMEAMQSEAERGEKALRLAGSESALREREKDAKEATEALATAKTLCEAARLARIRADAELETEQKREPERTKAQEQVTRLGDLRKPVDELARLQEATRKTDTALKAANAAAKTAADKLAACEEEVKREERRQTKLEAATEGLAGLQEMLKSAALAYESRERLDKAKARLAAAKKANEQAKAGEKAGRAAFTRAESQVDRLSAAWVKAQAGALARRLEDGKPCPVCGSKEHPRPAKVSRAAADEKALAEARESLELAKKRLTAAQKKAGETERAAAGAEAEVSALTKALGTGAKASAGAAKEKVSDLKAKVAKAREAKEQLRGLKAALGSLRKELAGLGKSDRDAQKSLKTAVEASTKAHATLKTREKDIPADVRDLAALERVIAEAQDLAKKLKGALSAASSNAATAKENLAGKEAALSAAEKSANTAAAQLPQQRAEFERAVKAEGFADSGLYDSAKRTRVQIEALRGEFESYGKRLAAAKHAAETTRKDAEGLVEPDLDALRAAADEARNNLQAAEQVIGALREKLRQLEDCKKRVAELRNELRDGEHRATALRLLADAASGQRPRNPGFHRFVLASKLEDVLAAANRRLAAMSGDRYRLLRVTQEENQKVAAGLNLEVLDAYGGKARPVDTLSGGETFLAALSLALGLADVVQQHAGGIKLDTVFIDEGFGTLDAGALDQAMRILEELHLGGRLVGVISHVAELKERLRDAQLLVTNTRGTSTARFIVR
jgi:exonuclease SbcC